MDRSECAARVLDTNHAALRHVCVRITMRWCTSPNRKESKRDKMIAQSGHENTEHARRLLTGPDLLISQIELRHLRYVIAIAEDLHFARAANRLHLAAP